jgi:hypothetical protein
MRLLLTQRLSMTTLECFQAFYRRALSRSYRQVARVLAKGEVKLGTAFLFSFTLAPERQWRSQSGY